MRSLPIPIRFRLHDDGEVVVSALLASDTRKGGGGRRGTIGAHRELAQRQTKWALAAVISIKKVNLQSNRASTDLKRLQ